MELEIQDLLAQGIIERSSSEYSARSVLVRKPNGSYRLCVNYKKLNKVTKFDCEPMNRPEDILAKIEGKRFFSELDFSRGFWQVEMDESSKEKTAFTTSSGCYQFLRMPFGLLNSPATFNRLMRIVLQDCLTLTTM